ncbi:stalk domain-containing protein [Peptoniphilus duerdenii]|uniref:stalk domain-containing protein n=1 Tax=Peptoniphilus duerdenii TaxID=507750 RepID=UPI00288C37D2|nr:stalk domain-containing protein [Peptoniphilus duerdenii]
MKTKNSKKVLALILSFFMILTVLPFNVMAEGDGATTTTPVEEPGTSTDPATPADPANPADQTPTKPALAPAPTDPVLNTTQLKAQALATINDKKAKLEDDLKKVNDAEFKKTQMGALTGVSTETIKKVEAVKDSEEASAAKTTIDAAMDEFNKTTDTINKAVQAQLEKEAKELAEAKKAANTALEEKATERKAEIDNLEAKVYDIEKSKAKVDTALTAAKAEVEKATTKDKVTAAKEAGVDSIKKVEPVKKETPAPVKKELSVSANVYYDAITGKVVDGNNNPVKDALVKVLGRSTYTDKDGNFAFNMTSESGNYYCGYYGYYWKDYPYNSYKLTTNTGSYFGSNGSYARYYFLVDGYGNIVDSVYAAANSSFTLHGESNKVYTVYYSDYGYGYGYGYPYYDKYYNRYYNPTTSWAKDQKLTASKTDYKEASVTLGYVTNNSWLYTTCYEYGYKNYYGYDRVIYPSQLSLSGNGTIVSGKVGVSYLPIYVYRNGVFLGSGNADVNGYFSIGLNSRVSSTSDLTFYAYGKTEATPQKKADHGVIPVKSTVVIGSTKLIKNINGVESDVNMDVAPFIRDGRTMLPLRYIAEALGFKVDWDRATRTVTLTDKEFKVQIPVETNKIIVNGSTYYSDANPVLRNGRTMLPVANIARALGLKDGTDILWDANTRVATITRLVKY